MSPKSGNLLSVNPYTMNILHALFSQGDYLCLELILSDLYMSKLKRKKLINVKIITNNNYYYYWHARLTLILKITLNINAF